MRGIWEELFGIGQTRPIYWAVMWESSNPVLHFELLPS